MAILTLDGQKYLISTPKFEDKEKVSDFFTAFWHETDSFLSSHNGDWCLTLTKDARLGKKNKNTGYYAVGFRPMLRPGRYASRFIVKDSTIVKMFTLTVDGKPVKIGVGNEPIPEWPALITDIGRINFTDQYYGEEYLIPWYFLHGMAFSTVPLLTKISWEELNCQGYVL